MYANGCITVGVSRETRPRGLHIPRSAQAWAELAHSVARPFQTGPAFAGLRFGIACGRDDVLADCISFASPCKGKAHSFRRSSSPKCTRCAGLHFGAACGRDGGWERRRSRLSLPVDGNHLLCQGGVGLAAPGVGVVGGNGLAVAGRLREADVAGDDGGVHLTGEMALDLLGHL